MCDNFECGYDGSDCLPFDPWEDCPLNTSCRHHFLDGICNVECNSAACLYDGGDCFPATSPCERVQECLGLVEDGQCAPTCNTLQCPYDGVDCSSTTDGLVSVQHWLRSSSQCVLCFRLMTYWCWCCELSLTGLLRAPGERSFWATSVICSTVC